MMALVHTIGGGYLIKIKKLFELYCAHELLPFLQHTIRHTHTHARLLEHATGALVPESVPKLSISSQLSSHLWRFYAERMHSIRRTNGEFGPGSAVGQPQIERHASGLVTQSGR